MKIKKMSSLAHGLSVVLVCIIALLFATSCGTYDEAGKMQAAEQQVELVEMEASKTGSSVNTKPVSAALKEQKTDLTTDSGTGAQILADAYETTLEYGEKEILGQAAELKQLIKEKEAVEEVMARVEKEIAEVTAEKR